MLAETRSQAFAVISLRNLYAERAISAGAIKISTVMRTAGLPKNRSESKESSATQGGVGDELPIPTWCQDST